jgi:two-component sensor histidine kinase
VPDSLPYIPAQEGRTLLDELNHRIKNELASIINLITFKAVWADNVEVKEALSDVVDLLHQHVAVHNILTTPDGDMLLDAGEQLRKLGLAMGRSTLDRMNIHLRLSAETLPLESERCWRLALAVYELVTNVVRHAGFDGRDGQIKIHLMRAGSWVNCQVTDNGSGLGRIKLGRGLRIVGDLASSLGGRIDRTSGPIWNSFSLDFPLTQREQRANCAVAGRRPEPVAVQRPCLRCLPRQSSVSGQLPSSFSPSSRAKDNTMSRKTLVTLSASMLLGAAIAAPTAALAQFGPPPGPPPMLGGPPPGLGAGGPPPGMGAGGPPLGGPSAGPVAGLPPRGGAGAPPREIAGGPPRLDGAGGLRGLERGGQANFRGIEGRAAAYRANGYSRNNYATYGYGRGYRHAYTAAATAAYAYGRADSSSDDGCYYVSAYRRYGTRRVLVCHED